MIESRILATVALSFVISPFAAPILAQTSGSILGFVRDEMDLPISGAVLQARSLSTAMLRSAESGQDGSYRLLQLSPGKYQLLVSAPGFSDYLNRDITLEIRQEISHNIVLHRAGVKEHTLTPRLPPHFLVLTTTEPSQLISLREIDHLPINGRRFLDFALLTPNVALSRDGRGSNNQIADGGLSVRGVRSWMNNFIIDGIESNNLYNGALLNAIPQEAVQEFRVSSGDLLADVGRTAGGAVNIATRSGSNILHGSIYNFLRNDLLDAHPPLARKGEDLFRQTQFGLALGAPIKQDKTFVFANYEGQRKAKQTGFSTAFLQNIDRINRRKADFGLPLEDPGVLPSDNSDALFLRADHKFNEKLTSTLRYNLLVEQTMFQFVGGTVLPSAGENAFIKNQTVAHTSTVILGKNLTGEIRIGYSARVRNKQASSGFEAGVKGTALLLVDVGSMGHLQTNIPMQNEEQTEVVGSLNYHRSSHLFRFGLGSNLLTSRAVLAFFDPPMFRTNLAGFLADPPVFGLIIAQEARSPVKVNSTAASVFFQDTWHVFPRLTLNYGCRYDLDNITSTQWSPGVLFRPAVVQPDKNNIQPRIGLAYSTSDANTVIRSSFGVYNDKRITQNSLYQLTFSPVIGAARVFSPVTDLTQAFLQFTSGNNYLASQFGPLTAQGIDPTSFVTPYSLQWSFGVEHIVTSNVALSAQYVGARGIHLISQVLGTKTNITPWDGITHAPNGLPDYQFRRLDPLIGQYRPVGTEGNSIYHGMVIVLKRNFSSRLGFVGDYTLSKTIDDSTHLSSSSAPQDPYRRDLERGLSNNDVRHRFALRLIASTPYSVPRVFRGLTLSVIQIIESGRPYSFKAGTDLNHDFLNTTDRVGLSGRNVFTGPAFATFDVRLSRNISLTERVTLDLTVDAFNALNRFNIQDINDVYGQATFAQPALLTFRTPTAAFDPRELQIAFRIRF